MRANTSAFGSSRAKATVNDSTKQNVQLEIAIFWTFCRYLLASRNFFLMTAFMEHSGKPTT